MGYTGLQELKAGLTDSGRVSALSTSTELFTMEKNYYGNAQVLSPTFMEQYLAGHRSQSDLNDALMSGGEFVPEIVNMSRIAGDIPTKDLRAMKAVAKLQYLSVLGKQPK